MISGDLIRLKNTIEDCRRMARSVQREIERLSPEERSRFEQYLSEVSPSLRTFLLEKQDPPS